MDLRMIKQKSFGVVCRAVWLSMRFVRRSWRWFLVYFAIIGNLTDLESLYLNISATYVEISSYDDVGNFAVVFAAGMFWGDIWFSEPWWRGFSMWSWSLIYTLSVDIHNETIEVRGLVIHFSVDYVEEDYIGGKTSWSDNNYTRTGNRKLINEFAWESRLWD